MAVRRGMVDPPQASDPTAVGGALTGPAAAWSASDTNAHPGAGPQAQAVGTPGLRLAVDGPDRVCHRLPARVLVLPVVPELRPLDRPRVRVRRWQELRRGDLEGRALHGLGEGAAMIDGCS